MEKKNEGKKAGAIKPRIMKCHCNPETEAGKYQEAMYGPGMRVHNGGGGRTSRANKPITYKCTCCGRVKNG